MIIEQPIVSVDLTNDEALLFREFQRNFHILVPLIGYLDTLKISDLKNSSITLDIDKNGKVMHTSVSQHFRY